MMFGALRELAARLLASSRSRELDRDFAQELDSHLAMLVEHNLQRGLTPDQARRAALIRMGAPSSLMERHRQARGLPAIGGLLQDLRFAIRLLAKDRWFAAAATERAFVARVWPAGRRLACCSTSWRPACGCSPATPAWPCCRPSILRETQAGAAARFHTDHPACPQQESRGAVPVGEGSPQRPHRGARRARIGRTGAVDRGRTCRAAGIPIAHRDRGCRSGGTDRGDGRRLAGDAVILDRASVRGTAGRVDAGAADVERPVRGPGAVSPDGRYVAYAQVGDTGVGLWLRQIATGADINLRPPEGATFSGIAFSHDGPADGEGAAGISRAPDGSIVYTSRASGNNDL